MGAFLVDWVSSGLTGVGLNDGIAAFTPRGELAWGQSRMKMARRAGWELPRGARAGLVSPQNVATPSPAKTALPLG
jgi:hypothetical protein